MSRAKPRPSVSVIGRDAGVFGRVFRFVSGTLGVLAGLSGLAIGGKAHAAAEVAAWLAGVALFYVLLYRGLAQRISERVDPFVASVLVLGTLPLSRLPVFPDQLHEAVQLYVAASLVLTSLIGYGGCEVVALPIALFGRRAVVYCPLNIVDAAERPLHGTGTVAGRIAAGLGLGVGGWYLIASPLLGWVGLGEQLSRWWNALLLLPAALLAIRAWNGRKSRNAVFVHTLGAAALVAGAGVLVGLVSQRQVFVTAMVIGLVVAAIRFARSRVDPSAVLASQPQTDASTREIT